jgi:hypothetical protein
MTRFVSLSIGLFILFAVPLLAADVDTKKIPKEVVDEMEYRVGEWDSKTLIDGVEQPGNCHEVTKWASGGKYCIIVAQTDVENGVARAGTCVAGWDPATNQLVERWQVSDGLFLSYHYNIDKAKNSWEGTFTCVEPDGKNTEGKSVVQKKSHDEWVWVGSWMENGKERTRSSINRRVK